MPIRLEIPGATPPSINRTGGRGGWRVWNSHKKWWENQIGTALLVGIQPKRELQTPVLVDATLWFTTTRKRDEGNFRALLEKACGDALVAGGWIPDDTPENYQFRSVKFMKGYTSTVLVVREGWKDSHSRVRPVSGPRPARSLGHSHTTNSERRTA